MVASPPRDEPRLVANVGALALFRERVGVWLSFTGAAYYKAYASELNRRGSKPSWVTAMAIIDQHPGITQSELGRYMAVNRASAMALAVEMEEAGLACRTLLPGRNKTALSLTEKGRASLEEGCHIEERLSQALLKDFTTEETKAFVRQLKLIERALQAWGDARPADA
ncbi:MarR family transcriptional regulator [Sphingobium sp. MK2]|uniref:MarR family winged helix-turn-helix transcriptional regulator n=1 Tax=Sphingobium sp. MK2 TaxID=3116540 RepID=UPI0032E35826